MGNATPPYPPEFRREVIRLVQDSQQVDSDTGVRHDDLTTEEVRHLQREIKTLREEREILLKDATFFAKETDAYR